MDTPRSDVLCRAPWPALLFAVAWSALAFYFSSAGNPIVFLAWIAPAPILAFAFAGREGPPLGGGRSRRRPARRAGPTFRLALAAFLAAFLGHLSWAVLYRGILPAFPLVAFAALLGAGFTAAVLGTRLVASRLGAMAGVLTYPALWVAVEFAFARLSPHGSIASLAYSQVESVRLIQLASWSGLAGITFVVCLVAAGIAAVFGDRGEKGIRWHLAVVPAAALVGALVAGQLRAQAATPVGRVMVGLVSVDPAMRFFETTRRESALSVLGAYVELAGDLAVRGADAVVMPEKMVGVTPAYEDEVSRLLSSLAEKVEIIAVAGLNKQAPGGKRNVASVFAKGRRVLEYEKQRLVPGFEDGYGRGDKAGIYRAPGGVTGVAICKDLDFPEIGREYSRAGIGVLLVPAWDFGRDGWLHSRVAVMRGVEGGYSVARAAANGLLTGSDSLGRVLAERRSDEQPETMLLAELPLGRGGTFYSRHGDWFAWTCVGLAGALLAAAGVRN